MKTPTKSEDDLKEKVQWTQEESDYINNIIDKAKVIPKRMSKEPWNNFVVVEQKGKKTKKYDAFLWHLNYDWFDVAKIIEKGQLLAHDEELKFLEDYEFRYTDEGSEEYDMIEKRIEELKRK